MATEDKVVDSPTANAKNKLRSPIASPRGGPATKVNYRERFAELTATDIDNQVDVFLKSFIFALGDEWSKIPVLAKQFSAYLKEKAEKHDLDAGQAADFLQKMGRTRTAMERRNELKDVDLDGNDKICFIEYLLLHYKVMVLKEYFTRHKMEPTVSLENDGVGLIGVGEMLLEQLFTPPLGMDPDLEKAITEFTTSQRERNKLVKDLTNKAEQGGVKGLAAKNELFQLESQDKTETNRLELTLDAAKRKASKFSGAIALEKKQAAEQAAKDAAAAESRAKLAARAKAFENK